MTTRNDDLDDSDEMLLDGQRIRVPMIAYDGLPDDVRSAIAATRVARNLLQWRIQHEKAKP